MGIIDQLRQRAKQRQQSQHPHPLGKGGSKPPRAFQNPEPIQPRPRPIKTQPRAPEGLKDPVVIHAAGANCGSLKEKGLKRNPEKMHVIPAAALEALEVLETFTPDQLTGVKISAAEAIVDGRKFMEASRSILQQAEGAILEAVIARVGRLVDCVPNLSKGPPAAQMHPSSM